MADEKLTFTEPEDWTPEDQKILTGLIKAAEIRHEEEKERSLRELKQIMNTNRGALP